MLFNNENRENQVSVFQGILAKSKNIYHLLPHSMRFVLWPLRMIYRFYCEFRLELWIIRGKEISSGGELEIMYAGNAIDRNYFTYLAYDDSIKKEYIGRRWLWKVIKEVKQNSRGCSLAIVEVPQKLLSLSKKLSCFYVPTWISGKFDISSDRTSIYKNKNSSLKSDMSKIKKNRLDFEVKNEISDLRNFYHNMYEPYIKRIHGDRTVFLEYDSVEKEFRRKGAFKDLLLIRQNDDYIAGVLLTNRGKWAKLSVLGIKNGNLNYVKDGAIGAIYYYSIQYLINNGFTTINLGGSRPFLKDGILQYKKKWKPKIAHHTKSGFIIKMLKETEGGKAFFLNNPFIFEDATGFKGAIFVDENKHLSEEDYENYNKQYYQQGISKLIIYKFGASKSDSDSPIPSSLSDRIEVMPVSAIFKANLFE